MWQDVENKFDKFQMDTASPGQVKLRAMQLAAMTKQETVSKISACAMTSTRLVMSDPYIRKVDQYTAINLLHSKMAEIFPTVMALNSVSC
jgi:hypothetical protein